MLPDMRWTLIVAGCDGFDSGTVTLSCAAANAAHAINNELTRIIYISLPFSLTRLLLNVNIAIESLEFQLGASRACPHAVELVRLIDEPAVLLLG